MLQVSSTYSIEIIYELKIEYILMGQTPSK